MTKLAVIVHENNEITVRDGRGVGVACSECRFSGWRSTGSYGAHDHPPRCLYASGGRDPVDGDRVLDSVGSDGESFHWEDGGILDLRYPRCAKRNPFGDCDKFVRAKPLPWWSWRRWFGREHRVQKHRE